MMIFDFQCTTCDHRFEDWDTSEATTKPDCPDCSSSDTRRLISKLRIDYFGMATDGKMSSDGFTTSVDRWAKSREDQIKIENRNMERHGTID